MTKQLVEGLEYKSLDGMLKPTLHIDEFSSKMGDDDDICVVSFYVTDEQAAKDLVAWFEKGYDFVLDADRSPGEISPNKYLVYIELKRRTSLLDNIENIFLYLENMLKSKDDNILDLVCIWALESFYIHKKVLPKILKLMPINLKTAFLTDFSDYLK